MSNQTAKLFNNGRSQAVRLPAEFRFEGTEVYIRKEGEQVILSPKPSLRATEDFMAERVDLPPQERRLF